jgi:hypothetical protein
MGLTKRKTVKIGPYTRKTITQSSKGTRITISNKPPGASTRRSTSTNLKTGSTRTNYTTKLGGGWFSTRSKTFTPTKKSRVGRTRSTRSRGGSGELSFWEILLLPILIPYWIIKGIFGFTVWVITNPWIWAGVIILIFMSMT